MRRRTHFPPRWMVPLLGIGLLATSACSASAAGGSDTVVVAIGYQSRTINTVTAGTLMRELGLFEAKLDELGEQDGTAYRVAWHDFASGPPLTAEMIAGNIHIGSMGDYPLSVNGARTASMPDVRTRWVSTTGYNLRGSLNQVVVPASSTATTLADLRGLTISTSLGSTAHGNLVSALTAAGMTADDVELLGQDPPVGVTALETAQVAALAQFVPFPQQVIFAGTGTLLHDGNTGVPTFHGVVASEQYIDEHPEVLQAFLAAQQEATEYLHENPLAASLQVAEATGLPPEVVYLYNGPNGAVTFDMTIKAEQVDAVKAGLPFLQELGALDELDVDGFVDTGGLRELLGDEYDELTESLDNPAAITGRDEICDAEVDDPTSASEAWPQDEESTVVAASPACLLELVAAGGQYRALYVPDTTSGTRIFGQSATWVSDPDAGAGADLLPFATVAGAEAYAAGRPGATLLDYDAALASVG